MPNQRALARVDLGAVARNCERLKAALTGGADLCAVVKADGYGHGAGPCACAALRGGATWLAVATAHEAMQLRDEGIDTRVLVMGALTPEDAQLALQAEADVVAWREGFVRRLAEWAEGRHARVHVKLDTGMGRLGTRDPEEAVRVADAVEADDLLELAGLMTHFATADEIGDEHFPRQLERFTAFAERMTPDHPEAIVHAANSAATLREPASHFDMVRCGIAVYGLDPFNSDPAEHGSGAGPVAELLRGARRALRGGRGRGLRPDLARRVAHLGGHAAHRLRRRLAARTVQQRRGAGRRPAPAAGGHGEHGQRDRRSRARRRSAAGEPAVLIGPQGDERILCEEVAQRLGTINYEVTCGLSARVPRLYER